MAQWRGQTRGGRWGYLFFIGLIRTLGVRVAYAFLAIVVIYFVPFAPRATASVWRYARRRLGYGRLRSALLVLRNYYRLGQILIDKVALGLGRQASYRFDFEGYTPFLDLLNSDTGVIMIGAHVGNWEIGVPFFDEYGKRINIVMYDNEHRAIKELLERHMGEPPFKVIPVNADSLEHVFKISEALDRHEYVCLQGDRYINEEKVLRTRLLGAEASFPLGPFLLAERMKRPVVFYYAMRERGMRYRFHFVIARPIARQRGTAPGTQLLEQYVDTLERILGQYPEQWFNYYDFWH